MIHGLYQTLEGFEYNEEDCIIDQADMVIQDDNEQDVSAIEIEDSDDSSFNCHHCVLIFISNTDLIDHVDTC